MDKSVTAKIVNRQIRYALYKHFGAAALGLENYDEELKREQLTKERTQIGTQVLQDPDLAKVVTAWPIMSPALKAAVLAGRIHSLNYGGSEDLQMFPIPFWQAWSGLGLPCFGAKEPYLFPFLI